MMATNHISIDRSSPVPVYYQIETDLKERIMNHEWEVNEQLPTEEELSRQYSVSRLTLRQALAELEKDGIIIKRRGRGTFINADPTPAVTELNYSVISADNISGLGHTVTAKVLEKSQINGLHATVSEHLGIPKDSSAVYIKRLFLRDGHPLAVSRMYISEKYAPGLAEKELINNSISQSLNYYYQRSAAYVEDSIETVRATRNDIELLGCKHDTPMILITGVSYLDNHEPMEYSTTLWNGDIVRFQLHLNKEKGGRGFAGTF